MLYKSAMSPAPDSGRFASTHWSLVLQARDRTSPQAAEALASLCRGYWYPLYVFIRRQVGLADRAEELTQEFFARLLEKDFLASADQSRGRFRSFLLACCKHFLANQHDADRAQKRGGGQAPVSLDLHEAGQRYDLEPAGGLSPEKLFERRWALTLLEQVLEQLGLEYHQDGKGELYDRLRNVLVGNPDAAPYAEIGAALGMNEAAVKKAAERLRRRYRDILREQIAQTVETPEQIDDEIRALFAALAS
jgi:RNA polymerase sigma-70 factor (ECF subfamily)